MIMNPFRFGSAAGAGGWVELGRTSGSRASGATLDVGSLPDKRYYMVLYETQGSSTHTCDYRLNSDSGTNYAYRASQNGTAETTNTSTNFMFGDYGGQGGDKFAVAYFANQNTKEKLGMSHQVRQGSTGSTAPTRAGYVHKLAQTSNPISTISLLNRGPNTSTSGEIVVLGWDPEDTHTDNFWEELDSVTLESANASLDSNTFSGKKYLMIQLALIPNSTDSIGVDMQINSDTGTNYPFRRSTNGGADGTWTGFNEFTPYPSAGNFPIFVNMFWINNTSNEKLGIAHSISANTTGSSNIPERREDVMKWVNTSNQITSLQFGTNTVGQFGTGSTLKVWGSD